MKSKGTLTTDLIQDLSNVRSAKRRSAAKKLRKRADPAAGPALLEALRREVKDPRTWETQYQMIMALGTSGYKAAVPFLLELTGRELEYMVCVAIGDALVRLNADREKEVLRILSLGHRCLAEGALRATAMLRLDLSESAVESLIRRVSNPENEQLQFWAAAAAPGWDARIVESFLRDCTRSERRETREAAQAALRKSYLDWNPLSSRATSMIKTVVQGAAPEERTALPSVRRASDVLFPLNRYKLGRYAFFQSPEGRLETRLVAANR